MRDLADRRQTAHDRLGTDARQVEQQSILVETNALDLDYSVPQTQHEVTHDSLHAKIHQRQHRRSGPGRPPVGNAWRKNSEAATDSPARRGE